MITIQNINSKWDEIKEKLSPEIVEIGTNNGFLETAESYEDLKEFLDDEAKEMLNKFISAVNKELEASKENGYKNDEDDDKEEPKKKPEKQPKEKKNFTLVCYEKTGEDSYEETSSEESLDNIFQSLKEAEKEAKRIFGMDNITAKIEIISSDDKVVKTLYRKETKKKSKKIEFSGEYVEVLSPEITYIKRYAKLNGKTVSEAKEAARRTLSGLQKAIVEKKIRKTSKYADEIMQVQKNLIKILSANGSIKIEIENVDKLTDIVKKYAVSECAKIIKSFISIQGKEGVKDKAKKLIERISKLSADGCGFDNEIKQIKKSCDDYVSGKTNTPEASEQMLNGLYGIAGIDGCVCKTGTPLGSVEFMKKHFSPMKFTGKWRALVGNPSQPYKMMIYGKAGSGKSTLSLQFAKYLASQHNQKVLYVAHEEGFSYTLQEKLERLGADDKNLSIVDTLPKNISNYDVIFIDSVNSMNIEPEELREIGKGKTFVYIFQTTKDGQFRGQNTFGHDVDVIVKVENKTANAEKNRFGGNSVINVF